MRETRLEKNPTADAARHRPRLRGAWTSSVSARPRNAAIVLATVAGLAGPLSIGCDGSEPSGADAGRTKTEPPAASTAASPGSRLDQVLETRDPFERARRLGELLPQLGPEAIPDVQAVLDRFRLHLGAVDFDLLVRFWATHDPEAATAWTFKRASPLYRSAASQTVIEVWARQDPAAALVAVENALRMADEDVARTVQLALVRGWFHADRDELERYIYSLGSGIKRQRAIFAFALTLAAEEGSEAVTSWAESLPEDDPRYKTAVFRQVLSALAWGDPAEAVRFCDAHCDGPFGSRLRVVLIRTRLRDGAEGAEVVEWVGGTPAETEAQIEERAHEIWVAYALWARRDRKEALEWMRRQIDSPKPPAWITPLYGEFARQVSVDSPEEAIQWAQKIDEEGERELTLVRIARRWLRQDEAAAEAWLEQSDLSERARQSARDLSLPENLPEPPQEGA